MTDVLPPETGDRIGRYRVQHRLAHGPLADVYLAATDGTSPPVALKVFERRWAGRLSLRDEDMRVVSTLAHPHILPIRHYEVSAEAPSYVAMDFAAGGSLSNLLAGAAVSLSGALSVVEAVAGALGAAHGQGILHRDVKPSNVLFGGDGQVLLADFGTSRISYGLIGTPGYLAPEQMLGRQPDSRADLYSLAVLAFEVLTGTRPFPQASPADALLATVGAPPPRASERNPHLPRSVDEVLCRGMAKVPEERYVTCVELADELIRACSRLAVPERRPGPAGHLVAVQGLAGAAAVESGPEASAAAADEVFDQSVQKLMEILNLSLTPSVMVDETSFVVGWNGLAEEAFGWTRDDMIGRSLVTTLIPVQYREAHERGLRRYLDTGDGPVLGQRLELSAMRKDGREMPIELSIAEAVRLGSKARILSFIRDISAEKDARLAAGLAESVGKVLEEAKTLDEAAPRLVEEIGSALGWAASVLWVVDAKENALRCGAFWRGVECPRFHAATSDIRLKRGDGLPGRAWADEEALWVPDLVLEEDSMRALAAAREGLHAAIELPVLSASGCRGVLELIAAVVRQEDPQLLARLSDIARRIERRYRARPGQSPKPD